MTASSSAESETTVANCAPSPPRQQGGTENAPAIGADYIRIDGELNIAHAASVQRQLLAAAGRGQRAVLDFSAVSGCDTAGLQLICSLRKAAFRVAEISAAIEAAAGAIGLPLSELTGGQGAGGCGHGV